MTLAEKIMYCILLLGMIGCGTKPVIPNEDKIELTVTGGAPPKARVFINGKMVMEKPIDVPSCDSGHATWMEVGGGHAGCEIPPNGDMTDRVCLDPCPKDSIDEGVYGCKWLRRPEKRQHRK